VEPIDYYVYYHVEPGRIRGQKLPVYIGVGTKDRAWYMRNRDVDHLEWLMNFYSQGYLMDELVEIKHRRLSKKDAHKLELQLISELRPKFNKNYDYPLVKLTKKDIETAKELKKAKVSYVKIAEIFNVSAMTIHRALTGGTKKYERYL